MDAAVGAVLLLEVFMNSAEIIEDIFSIASFRKSFDHVRARHLRKLPFPAKLGIMNLVILPLVLILMPPANSIPPIGLALMWIEGYCLSLAAVMLLPRRRALHVAAHWVE